MPPAAGQPAAPQGTEPGQGQLREKPSCRDGGNTSGITLGPTLEFTLAAMAGTPAGLILTLSDSPE